MSRLIDPNEPTDELEEEMLEANMPPAFEPEPDSVAIAILSASTDFDEDVPF